MADVSGPALSAGEAGQVAGFVCVCLLGGGCGGPARSAASAAGGGRCCTRRFLPLAEAPVSQFFRSVWLLIMAEDETFAALERNF